MGKWILGQVMKERVKTLTENKIKNKKLGVKLEKKSVKVAKWQQTFCKENTTVAILEKKIYTENLTSWNISKHEVNHMAIKQLCVNTKNIPIT